MAEVRANTFIYPYGSHVLYVEYRSHDPLRAQQTVSAIVATYTDLYKSQIRDKALRSKSFYEEQLEERGLAVEKASGELKTYLANHPQLANVDLTNPPSLALRDIELARLAAAELAARESYDQTLEKFADSQISANTVDGTIPNFLVMDEPELPFAQITPGKRSLLMPPALGLASGLFISAAGFVVYWRLDRRIHLADDLAFLDARVPRMTIPSIAPRRRRWPPRFLRVASALQSGLRPRELAGESGGPS
jgi:uncharacterized protein involved in exopolysaccharide biosynthesis